MSFFYTDFATSGGAGDAAHAAEALWPLGVTNIPQDLARGAALDFLRAQVLEGDEVHGQRCTQNYFKQSRTFTNT